MKALVLEKYMQLAYTDVPVPDIGEQEVLVKVKAIGICGSDVHGIDGSTGRRMPPIIMGHEASGIIEQTGKLVTEWKAGDRVTFDSTIYNTNDWYTKNGMYNLSDGRMVLGVSCNEFTRNGAYADYVAVPQHILYRLPDNVSFVQAALVEPAAVALHAIEITPFDPSYTAIVVGAGMVGSFVVQLLKIKGCKNIVAVDLDEGKLELAKKLGADFVYQPGEPDLFDKVLSLTGGRGADIAFEVVGISATIRLGIELLRKGATLTVLGNLSPVTDMPLQTIVTRQIRIQGSCAINGEYPAILDLISSGKLDMKTILSAEAPLSEGASWFSRLYNKEKGLMKVVLKP
ncbi:MAG: galactitol-1-phosphate 5-dehydrogenase [Chitinophagaceae bacterium]|nr:galactitol-1-phosphate 5-dehydrogenase [Chitinophagaceae bacterium]